MPVSIGAITLNDVLTWHDETTSTIPIKKILRKQGPTTQAPYFARTPLMITIRLRSTRALKTQLVTLKNQHTWQLLRDYDNSIVDWVWMEQVRGEWRGDIDFDYPWLVTLELICSST